MFKHKFEFERYLTILPSNLLHYFSSFRTRKHRLEVETGRWTDIKYDERKCNLCKVEIGNVYDYLLTCKHLDNIRKSHIKPKYFIRPNIIMPPTLKKMGSILRSACPCVCVGVCVCVCACVRPSVQKKIKLGF